jgi:hypothetical protein
MQEALVITGALLSAILREHIGKQWRNKPNPVKICNIR